MATPRKDRLGKGLGALLGDYFDEDRAPGESEIRAVPVDQVVPNPFQPRREFAPEELAELAGSIRENGLLQPLLVRPAPEGKEGFQLVAGERRLRAVRSLGWDEVAVVVREVDDPTLLVLALVENLQREALGPLEEAEGYQALSDRFDLTQEEIAEAVGKSRSSVANMLRLLKLPPSVRKHLEAGTLTMGHARALVTVPDPVRAGELARRAVAQGWSVRQMEERARRSSSEPSREEGSDGEPRGAPRTRKDPVLRALEAELQEVLATRVRVRTGTGEKGTIEIPYHSSEDLERLFALLAGREASEVVG